MSLPKITILMPVYNSEKYLSESIESILNQTFHNFEFLIIDDASTDLSSDIAKNFKDSRIKLIQNEKKFGVAGNLNKGISLAKGKYIARMDSDDISLPMRLEEQFNFMELNKNIAVCGTWVKFIGKKIAWLKDNILRDPSEPKELRCCLLFNCVLKHPSVMIRKKVFDLEGYKYNEKISRAEDYDLWVRISKKYDLSNVTKVLFEYRIHKNSTTRIHRETNIKQANEIRKSLLQELGMDPTNQELDLHYKMSKRSPNIILFKHLNESNEWLQKILISNKKKRIYDENALNKVLSQKWESMKKHFSCPK